MTTKEVSEKSVEKEKILCPHCGKEINAGALLGSRTSERKAISSAYKSMTNKEVAEIAGIAESTVRKYAPVLDIHYYGTGRHKIYDWKKSDIERLKKAIGRRGRPQEEDVKPESIKRREIRNRSK